MPIDKLSNITNYIEIILKFSQDFLRFNHQKNYFFSGLWSKYSREENLLKDFNEFIQTLLSDELNCLNKLSHHDQNELLNVLLSAYNKFIPILKNNFNKRDIESHKFNNIFEWYSKLIKEVLALFSDKSVPISEVNLCYLPMIIENREIGISCLSNYDYLKREAEYLLQQFIDSANDKDLKIMFSACLDTIKKEAKSINYYSNNYKESTLNLLKFMNTLRLVLIDKKESLFLPNITMVLDRFFGVFRPIEELQLSQQTKNLKQKDLLSRLISKYEVKPTLSSKLPYDNGYKIFSSKTVRQKIKSETLQSICRHSARL